MVKIIILYLLLTGCATSIFPEPGTETILRKYNVPIMMEASNINLENGEKVPVICFQCVVIYVSAEVPKDFSLQVPIGPQSPNLRRRK